MAEKHERRFESVVQTQNLAQSPEYKSGGGDAEARSSGRRKRALDGRRPLAEFTFSRETVLRLIDWIKEE